MTVFKNVTSPIHRANNGEQSRSFNGCFIIETAIEVCALPRTRENWCRNVFFFF